jgi:uncharacterized membrane protein
MTRPKNHTFYAVISTPDGSQATVIKNVTIKIFYVCTALANKETQTTKAITTKYVII